MDARREAKAAEIFADALELPAPEQLDFVRAACSADRELYQRVETLLKDRKNGRSFFRSLHPGEAARRALEDTARDANVGRMIGSYRLTRRVAEGGMGLVYEAKRADAEFDKRVAVKIIHPVLGAADILARFATERQVLARLEHPNIARLIDGGSTEDGLPWLMMEYVEGTRVDVHCDRNRLSLRERLELFCTLCAAIHHAHRNLVVHRDLKPGNILVDDEGHVKVLDFGIAKVLDPESGGVSDLTRTGMRAFTPRYASPEQVRGEPVSTATDVYSLGVVLYELLTGRSPYPDRVSASQLERMVCEAAPARPSTVVTRPEAGGLTNASESRTAQLDPYESRRTNSRRLRGGLAGDLDTIVLKALRKEPERRYASAHELAEDLRRHMAGLTVRARPDTARYRLSKFVRRNKALVIGVSIAFAALAVGLGFSILQSSRAVRARVAEEAQRAEAEWQAYVSRIGAAESSIRTNQVAEARRVLEGVPSEMRGWEWRHLQTRLDRSHVSILAHDAAITAVAFGADDMVATASRDSTLRLWDAKTGRPRGLLGPFASPPHAVVLDPNAPRVFVGDQDGGVSVWTRDGTHLATLREGSADPFPPNNLEDDTEMMMLNRPSRWAEISLDATGSRIAVASWEGRVTLWDATSLAQISEWQPYRGGNHRLVVVWHPRDPKLVATGFGLGHVRLWRLERTYDSETVPTLVRSFRVPHTVPDAASPSGVVDLAFAPDGERVAAANQDGTVRVWNVSTGDLTATLAGHSGSVRSITFDAAGNHLVSAATDGRLVAWDPKTGNDVAEMRGHTSNVHDLAFNADGTLLATGDQVGVLKLWSWPTHDVPSFTLTLSPMRRNWADRLDVSSDGSQIVATSAGDIVYLIDRAANPKSLTLLKELGRTSPSILRTLCVRLTPDGEDILVGRAKGWLMKRNAETDALLYSRPGHAGDARALDVHPGGMTFATCGYDSLVKIWDRESGSVLRTLRGHRGAVLDVRYDPNGSLVASGAADSSIRVWNAADGSVRHVLRGHEAEVVCVAFSEDGRLLASASYDGSIRVWRVADGAAIATPIEGERRMYAVAFNRDGTRLAAGGLDGFIRLFETTSYREVARLHGHGGRIFWLEFAVDDALVSTSLDGTVRVWEAPNDESL